MKQLIEIDLLIKTMNTEIIYLEYFIHHLRRCKKDSDKMRLTIFILCRTININLLFSKIQNEINEINETI
jgi:hypothetical protein